MKQIKYIDYIINQADIKVKKIKENGCLSGGSNGPYNDNETPVRVCAHWICIFSWLNNKEPNKKYVDAIKTLAEYLYNQKINLSNDKYTFCSRNKKGKDHVNGTIGPAWIIEGLIEATKTLNDEKYYNLAVKIFLTHPFNKKIGCWNRYEINGKLLGYDETFNHQLWLAAAGAEIIKYKKNDEIKEQINCFLNKCLNNKLFRTHKNGVICHFACISENIRRILSFYKRTVGDIIKKRNLNYKEEGYHYFALYGFALIKDTFPEHPIFNSKKIKKAVEYAIKKENYVRQIERNPEEDGTGLAKKIKHNTNIYCFPYNSPTFELPYIIKQFKPDLYNYKLISELWKIQKEITMDKNGNLTKNINDEITLNARIYELLKAID